MEIAPGITAYFPTPRDPATLVDWAPGFTLEVTSWGYTPDGRQLPRFAYVEAQPESYLHGSHLLIESDQEIVVHTGELNDEDVSYPAGTVIHIRRGTARQLSSRLGCIFTLYCPDLLTQPPGSPAVEGSSDTGAVVERDGGAS
ncbi:hypothetical protein [Streptomyces nanshensis]|uniref:Cupin n=1 Tax=Streptomyces nanshensis TaxID=518642 RepID=A0A1E7L5H1_9ACTN|nr:hypothetical protein [Streptomyces nanshensis]OEV11408.1 hypothetical protein AN218_13065 [Streptomyces nanshensis]